MLLYLLVAGSWAEKSDIFFCATVLLGEELPTGIVAQCGLAVFILSLGMWGHEQTVNGEHCCDGLWASVPKSSSDSRESFDSHTWIACMHFNYADTNYKGIFLWHECIGIVTELWLAVPHVSHQILSFLACRLNYKSMVYFCNLLCSVVLGLVISLSVFTRSPALNSKWQLLCALPGLSLIKH